MRRLSAGLVDQILSSLSNVLVVFAVAGVSTVPQFGRFAVIFLFLNAAVAVSRGLIGNHISLRAGDHDEVMGEGSYGLVSAVCLGASAAIGFLLVGLIIPTLATLAVPIAVACPLVLAQDVTRFVSMADARPVVACFSDGTWAVMSFVALGAVWAGTGLDAHHVLAIWGLGGTLALVVAMMWLGLCPKVAGLGSWFRHRLRHRLSLAVDSLLSVVSTLVVLAAAGHFIGVAAVAALQGAASAFGPVALTMRSIPIAVVPEVRRRRLDDPVSVWRFMKRIARPLSLLSVVAGAAFVLVPRSVGELALGDSWDVVAPILPITGVEWAMIVWLGAATGGMQALERAEEVLKVRVLFVSLAMVLGAGSAAISGSAAGVALGLCVAAFGAAAYARRSLLDGRARVAELSTGSSA